MASSNGPASSCRHWLARGTRVKPCFVLRIKRVLKTVEERAAVVLDDVDHGVERESQRGLGPAALDRVALPGEVEPGWLALLLVVGQQRVIHRPAVLAVELCAAAV